MNLPPLELTQIAIPTTGDSQTSTGAFFSGRATAPPSGLDLVSGVSAGGGSLWIAAAVLAGFVILARAR